MCMATCLEMLLIACWINSGMGEGIYLNHKYDRDVRKPYGTTPSRWRHEFSTENSLHPWDATGVIPKPLVITKSSLVDITRKDDELTDESRWKYEISPTERAHKPWLDEEKTVKIHIYRGPNEKYTVLKRKPERKYFAPWGYFVSQPISSYKGKPSHDLSFHYS